MKRMKKILALGLVSVLTLGMSLTAWAAPGAGTDTKVGTKDDKGSITVSGIEETEDSTVEAVAYPIIQAHYDAVTGIFDGYTKLYADLDCEAWQSIEVTEDGLITGYTGDTFDADVVNKIFEKATDRETVDVLAGWILGAKEDSEIEGFLSDGTTKVTKAGISLVPKKESVTDPETNEVTQKTTSFTNSDVPVGTYLVIIKNSEIKNYNPVLVSSYYTNANQTGNGITDGTLNITAGEAWVKVTDSPSVDDKEVTQVKRPGSTDVLTDDAGENITGSANLGDVLTYRITVKSIPYYGGKSPVFKLTDTLGSGLKYTDNAVKVVVDGKSELVRGTDYKITDAAGNQMDDITGKTEMVIDFVVGEEDNKAYTLNSYQGKNMVIEYQATVQDDAALNEDPNENSASLEYSKNSHLDGEEGEDPGKITRTYTFDISGIVNGNGNPLLEKVDAATKEALGGAEFTLYTDSGCKSTYTNSIMADGKTTSYKVGDVIGDERLEEGDPRIGTFLIRGLAEGTYWMKETKAPEGYSLNEHAYKIEITAEYEEKTETIEGKDFAVKTLTAWSVKIDDKDADTFSIDNEWKGIDDAEPYPIQNTKLISLPSTGGIGTTVFTVAGVLLMAGAVFLFFVNRRKTQNGQEK